MEINKEAFGKMTYGIYLIGSCSDGKVNAMIGNSAVQTTSEPACFAVVVNKESLTCDFIKKSKKFCVQPVCQKADMLFIGNFGFRSGKTFNKFEKYSYELSDDGLPVVTQNTLAFIAAQTVKEEDLGTHIMFIGKVTQSKVLAQEEPMSYDFYHNVLKGKTPKGATTFQGS